MRERDLRETGWWVIERLTGQDQFDGRHGAVVASVLRVLASLGPPPLGEDEALAETELRGRIAHGRPPHDAAEWERALRRFAPDAIDDFRRWEEDERPFGLHEGD